MLRSGGRGGPETLRGVRCNVCNALGEHYSSHCPLRGRVGVPAALQPPVAPVGVMSPELGSTEDSQPPTAPLFAPVSEEKPLPAAVPVAPVPGPSAVATVPEFPPTAILGPQYLTPQQLYTAVVTRSDVPAWCTCCACGLIASEAVWCSRCNAVACATCMTPAGPESLMCPVCCSASADTIFVVEPLRRIIDTLFIAMASEVDAAGEAAPPGTSTGHRQRHPRGGPHGASHGPAATMFPTSPWPGHEP